MSSRPARIGPVFLFLAWLIAAPAIGPALAEQPPINDYAGILPSKELDKITGLVEKIRAKTGWRIMVATVKSIGDGKAGSSGIDEIAGSYFRRWGLDRDGVKGCLIFIALDQRKLSFQVSPGLQKLLTGEDWALIRDRFMVPHFERPNYPAGVTNSLLALGAKAAAIEKVDLDLGSQPQEAPGRGWDYILVAFLAAVAWFTYNKLKARRQGPPRRNGVHGFGSFGGGFKPFDGGRIG